MSIKSLSPAKYNHRLFSGKTKYFTGFTLIELLIVIGIIAILAAAVIITITPGERLAEARNATRHSHLNSLESSLYIHMIDNEEFPSEITSTLTEICNTNLESPDCTGLVDLSAYNFLIPVDPQAQNDGTGYEVAVQDGRVILNSIHAEGTEISVGGESEGGGETTTLPSIIFNGDTLYIHPTDNSTGMTWGPIGNTTEATSNTDGESNTATIVGDTGGEHPAAELCDDLNAHGRDDWFLPAIDQLETMYNQWDGETLDKGDFEEEGWEDFASDYYWSSTEGGSNIAYFVDFDGGFVGGTSKTGNIYVRCVAPGTP